MKPDIIVVDEEDKVIGHKPREEVDEKGLIYRVAALWITNSKGEILLARRAYTKTHYPGRLGPAVAGTVDKGESYEENIKKEAEEEIGLKNLIFKKGPKSKVDGKYNHFTQWFTCTVDKPPEYFKIQKEEVVEVKWFSKEELKEQLKNNPEEFVKPLSKYLELFD